MAVDETKLYVFQDAVEMLRDWGTRSAHMAEPKQAGTELSVTKAHTSRFKLDLICRSPLGILLNQNRMCRTPTRTLLDTPPQVSRSFRDQAGLTDV